MDSRASGTFEVKLAPLAPGRISIDKQFHGDLEATSQGEMLTAATEVKGSAGYVDAKSRATQCDGGAGLWHGRIGGPGGKDDHQDR